ncbi:MAG: hypothetical protein COV67_08395 [Nitrospinae bacterium CG11_big_fil_rev_8_21_14_0_20_56_8]|nr:MAG: hypothetical protein COV67_08395 [Nitrospinae bacterium CG11_big_fil_rev_8_21_14_0_20_56_8]
MAIFMKWVSREGKEFIPVTGRKVSRICMGKNVAILLLTGFLALFPGGGFAGNKGNSSLPLVEGIRFEGNILFDGKVLADRLGVGEGARVNSKILKLFEDEIRAYYASYGFYYVLTQASRGIRDGILPFRVDEVEEFRRDRLSAIRAVKRTAAVQDFDLDPDSLKAGVENVLGGYKLLEQKEAEDRIRQKARMEQLAAMRLADMQNRVQQMQGLMRKIQGHKAEKLEKRQIRVRRNLDILKEQAEEEGLEQFLKETQDLLP